MSAEAEVTRKPWAWGVLLSFRMAFEHARFVVGRVLLSVLTIAVGVALAVAILASNSAVLQSFVGVLDSVAGRANLTVTGGEGVTFSREAVRSVADVPGVEIAVPLLTGVTFPDDGSGELLTLHGIDLTNDRMIRVYHARGKGDVVRDELEFLNDTSAVILGREYAERRHIAVGDAVSLITPTGVKTFKVHGLVDPDGLAGALGGRLVVMDLYAAQLAFAAEGQVSRLDLVVRGDADVADVQARVAATLPPGLRVEEPGIQKVVFRRTIGGFQTMLTSFGLIGILAGAVVCYSRLRAIFEARAFEIGLMRAVGLRRSAVFVELLKEAVLLGAVGGLIGVVLGVVLSRFVLPALAASTALNFRLPIPIPTLSFDWGAVGSGMLMGVGTAVLAAAAPALRLARIHPASVMRLKGRHAVVEDPAGGLRVGLLVAVCACVLIVVQLAWGIAALGHVTTVVIALGGYVLALPLLSRSGGILRSVWGVLFGRIGSFAVDEMETHTRRLAPMVAALGVGVGSVLMFAILSNSLERTLVEQLSRRFVSDLVVASAETAGGYRWAPTGTDVLEALRNVPGVETVVGNQARDVEYDGGTSVIDACDRGCFASGRINGWPIESSSGGQPLKDVERGRAVMVSSSFAYKRGTKAGDLLRMKSPTGIVERRVAAITSGTAEDAILMTRKLYEKRWNDPLIYLSYVNVLPGADRATVEEAIRREIGEKRRMQVMSSSALVEYFASIARQAFAAVYVMVFIALVLVMFGIGDTLATTVVERLREFGMLRAVGLRRAHIFGLLLLEGGAVGVLGLALAAGVGLALGLFWVKVQFPAMLGWQVNFHLPVMEVLIIAILTLLLCIIGSLAPSWRASHLPVATVLRND